MKKSFLAISLSLSFLGYSQSKNDNWYFGYDAGINFTGSSPQLLNNSAMLDSSTAGTVSDDNGQLLFYTNGKEVWNRNHQVMPNGNIDQESVQMQIVKHPTNPNQYYIFSTNLMGYVLRYSVVDMSQGSIGTNGLPLGDILVNLKNVHVLDESGNEFSNARGVTAISHADSNSFWILVTTGTKLYSYRLSGSGLSTSPVVNNLNTSGFYAYYSGISLKASPQINYSCNFSNYISLTYSNPSSGENEGLVKSFNNLTGQVTADYHLSIGSMDPIYAEFNKNANILYFGRYVNGISTNQMFYSVDLINSSNTSVVYNVLSTGQMDYYNTGGPITMQRNAKGDIYTYVPYYNAGHNLSKMVNPDVFGSNSVDLNGIDLSPTGNNPSIYVGSTNNLPQLIPDLKSWSGQSCVPLYTLSTPEINAVYTYHASNAITADQTYEISSGKNITMKAGNTITLLPNTTIEFGAEYLAEIEDCNCTGGELGKNQKAKDNMRLDLRTSSKEVKKAGKIKLAPNPTSDILYIQSDSKIKSISVSDLTGRKINVKLDDGKVDVRSIPSGVYVIAVETAEGITTENFIKK